MIKIENTLAIRNFLRKELNSFIKIDKPRSGRPWGNTSISDYILTEFGLKLDETAIRHFRKENSDRIPKRFTLQCIAKFIIHQKQITHLQLKLVQDTETENMASISHDFFGYPNSETFNSFLDDLCGIYFAVNSKSQKLLVSELNIRRVSKQNVFIATETIDLFSNLNVQELRRCSDNLAPHFSQILHSKFRNSKINPTVAYKSKGYVLFGSNMMTCLLKECRYSFPSVLSFDGVVADENDEIVQFIKSQRYTGWRYFEPGETDISEMNTSGASMFEVAQQLSKGLEFQRFSKEIEEVIDADDLFADLDISFGYRRKTKEKQLVIGKSFEQIINCDIVNSMGDREEADLYDDNLSPDKNLEISVLRQEFERFEEALARGADANLIPEGLETPILFGLSGNGMTHWVKTLIKTGRCDCTIRNKVGVTASHEAGVTALMYGPAQPKKNQSSRNASRFREIAQMIDEEEIRQINIQRIQTKFTPT